MTGSTNGPATGPDGAPLLLAAHNGARILGGGEIWTVRLLQGLRERGYRVLLYCRDPAMEERFRAEGIPTRAAPVGGQAMLPHALSFAARLGRDRPDRLLLTTFKKTWLTSMGAWLARVPRVLGRIGLSTDLPSRHWTYRVAFRRWIDRTAVNAEGIRRAFLADLPGLDPGRVVTVYDGVEIPERRREPGAVRRELAIDSDTPVVGTVARLTRQKRLDRMLAVLARLPGDTHLIVAGDGELEADLRAHAEALGVSGRAHWLGFRDDVGDVLAALDVYLVTSDREGMSNAMLEALAAGLPVVSTPVSGADEALDALADGRRPGRIVEAEEEAVSGVVRSLLADTASRRAMGEAAVLRHRERFSYPAMLDAWERFLTGPPTSRVRRGPSTRAGPGPRGVVGGR